MHFFSERRDIHLPDCGARGAGGQFIFMFPELDLVTVITSHDKGMGDMLKTLPQQIIPAFTQK